LYNYIGQDVRTTRFSSGIYSTLIVKTCSLSRIYSTSWCYEVHI